MPTDPKLKRLGVPYNGVVTYDSRYGRLTVTVTRHPGRPAELCASSRHLLIHNVAYTLWWDGPTVDAFNPDARVWVQLNRLERAFGQDDSTQAADTAAGDLVRRAVVDVLTNFDPQVLADAWLIANAPQIAGEGERSLAHARMKVLDALHEWAKAAATVGTYRQAAGGDLEALHLSAVRDQLTAQLPHLMALASLPAEERAEVCYRDAGVDWVAAGSVDEAFAAARRIRPNDEIRWVRHDGRTVDAEQETSSPS